MENQQLFTVRPIYPTRIPYADDISRTFAPSTVSDGVGRSTYRSIFGLRFDDPNMAYSDFELNQLQSLEEAWDSSIDPLEEAKIEETQKMRFLQGCDWDIPSTKKAIYEYARWRVENPYVPRAPPDRNDPDTWIFFHGRDKSFRPVIYIDCEKLQILKGKSSSTTFVVDSLLDIMGYFVASLAVPGKIEQVLVIADLEGCSFWDTPLSEMSICVHALTSKFRGRLNKLIMINTPLIFYSLWQVLRPLIPDRTLAKIKTLRFDHKDELLASVDDDELDPAIKERFDSAY